MLLATGPAIRLRLCVLILVLLNCACAQGQYTLFSDSFDDGNWTSQPRWEYVKTGPISVSDEQATSAPYSLKVATNNESGAIRAYSGLTSTTQPFTCTFRLHVHSMGDEAIPLALQSSGGGIAAIVFILPNCRAQLSVSNATGGWSVTSATSTYALSLGQWHTVKLAYDGVRTALYIDDHAQPDAEVAQSYVYVPQRICVGNFGSPHASTFFLDDLAITGPTKPGRIYVQVCSDTSTGGISISNQYALFPADDYSYTTPAGQAAQVMAEPYRDSLRDSMGNPIKFTWYMQCGSLYGYGISTGPLLPFELMEDYHGPAIERWGDEMSYHYHTWIWNDPDGDGVYHWNEAPDFASCQDDFERTVAHLILDRAFFPSSFRSGWHYMDNYFQRYLDDWYPYRFENDYPAIHTDAIEPIDNVYDWSRAPSAWVPYHPSPDDYQTPGGLRGWESRSRSMSNMTSPLVLEAFSNAMAGTTQILTLFSHLKEEDFPNQVVSLHSKLVDAHDCMPQVEFEYLTARECMLKWRNGTDTTAPHIQVSTTDTDGVRTAVISTDEAIYQKQPFVAIVDNEHRYSRIDCTPIGPNTWQVQYRPDQVIRVAVAVSDWFGNTSVYALPAPLLMYDLQTMVDSDSAAISCKTTVPADVRVEYRLAPSGEVLTASDSVVAASHRVSLTGLLPESIYLARMVATDTDGRTAQSDDLYIITGGPVVDNPDARFSTTGSWSMGTVAGDKYGPDYRYAMTNPDGTSSASWSWQVPETGDYDISAWWSAGSNRSTACQYTVFCNGIEYPKTMNQQIDGGSWNLLGTYSLTAGDTVVVRLSNAAPSGFVVIADAIEFQRTYIPVSGISLARSLSDSTKVKVSDCVVTAVFGSEYYIEQRDRASGMKVIGTGVSPDDIVTVRGRLNPAGGERAIIDAIAEKSGERVRLDPLAITGMALGDVGLNPSGMLVTVCGTLHATGTDSFYVDDGAPLDDGGGVPGIRVDASGLSSVPDALSYAIVTGILAAQDLGTREAPVVRPRSSEDCVFILQ